MELNTVYGDNNLQMDVSNNGVEHSIWFEQQSDDNLQMDVSNNGVEHGIWFKQQ